LSDIVIRELTGSDRAAIGYELRHLGERSMFQRYLSGSTTVSRPPKPLGWPASIIGITRG
jgi:hypothetical protein